MSGRADAHRHGHPERRHARGRRGRPGRRDPRARPLSPRPDPPDLPEVGPRRRPTRGRGGRRPRRHRRLQPRAAARPRRAARGRPRRRGEPQDHDPHGHGPRRPDDPDAHASAARIRGRRVPPTTPGCTSSAARTASARRSPSSREQTARRSRSTAGGPGSTSATTPRSRRTDRRGRGAPRRPRPRDLHRRHPARRPPQPSSAPPSSPRSSTSTSPGASSSPGRRTRPARSPRLPDPLRVELVHARPANYVAYSASKAAVVNLAQGLAEEWAHDGIRVNAVSPERTDTPMRRVGVPRRIADRHAAAREVARRPSG